MAFVRSGMAGKDVASMLGVSSAAVVYNWARAAEDPSPAAADRSPIEPMRDSEDRAYDGFEGSLEERVRQLELENDILRAAAKVLKAGSPGAMTNREKALVINELRATTGRSLRELTDSLRISKSSYEYQRRAISRPGRYAKLLFRVISMCYERRSLLFTTNIDFSRWAAMFSDPDMAQSMLDRVIHHGRLITYDRESYRVKNSLMRADAAAAG